MNLYPHAVRNCEEKPPVGKTKLGEGEPLN